MNTAPIASIKPKAPQVEDGYTRIANELFDAILSFGLTGRELSVVMAIIRKTYGYNKKQDDISASQIGALCGLARPHVTSTLKKLEAKQIIHKRIGSYGSVIGIQKDYSRWLKEEPKNQKRTSTKLVLVPIQYEDRTDLVQGDRTDSVHTKDNLPKDNQQKTSRAIALATFLSRCKDENRKPVPEDDPVFSYADSVGIPIEFIRLAWVEFKRKYTEKGAKRYINWNQHFQNAVRENWYRIWFEKGGTWELTTRGLQIQKELKEAKQ
jgi:phage replication O-like protein O